MADQKLRYLVIEQGRVLRQYFRSSNPLTGATYNLRATGYNAAILQVRTAYASDGGILLFELTTENGGISLDYVANDGTGKSWSGYIFAMPSATNLTPFQDAVYDLSIINDNGYIDTLSRGPAMLIPQASVIL